MSRAALDLVVNGVARSVHVGATLGDVVTATARSTDGVAAAVNGEVVPRSLWDRCALGGGDRVEVVTAVQGG